MFLGLIILVSLGFSHEDTMYKKFCNLKKRKLETKKVAFSVDVNLAKRFSKFATKERLNKSALTEHLIQKFLEKYDV